MTERVAVLVPVLNRPKAVKPLLDSLTATATTIGCDAWFLCSPGDRAEIRAIMAEGANHLEVEWGPGPGDYARKINYGFRYLRSQYRNTYGFYLFGADDLRFHPGWVESAVAQNHRRDACVMGTNDLGNRRVLAGAHSTHPLVHRDYWECGTIDEQGKVLHEGYDHQYTDDEFIQTAIWRDTYQHCQDSVVEHMHPDWGKGAVDDTYKKGKARGADDRALYESRKAQWGRR